MSQDVPSVQLGNASGDPAPYEAIAQHYQAKIESGQLRVGERLPTVREIADIWSVARGTANRAIAVLVQAGLVTTGGRSGTIVADSVGSTDSTIIVALSHGPSISVVSAAVESASDVAAGELGIQPGSAVIVVQLKITSEVAPPPAP